MAQVYQRFDLPILSPHPANHQSVLKPVSFGAYSLIESKFSMWENRALRGLAIARWLNEKPQNQ